MYKVLRHVALLLFLWTAFSRAQATDGGYIASSQGTTDRSLVTSQKVPTETRHSANSQPLNNATCNSRTVNYITHTLPQQCLRTDRVAANGTQTTASSDNTTGSAAASEDLTSSTMNVTPSGFAFKETSGSRENDTVTANITSTAAAARDEGIIESSFTNSYIDVAATESATPEPKAESESPLDNANFLSFEEWKKQNLAKAGQSPEHVGQERQAVPNRPRPGISNAMDTLGEDIEIDLDFSGFGGGPSSNAAGDPSASPVVTELAAAGQASPGTSPRSKDAGKTCKERTNYASFDCAATVLKNNPECKHASSVLVENKDSYMLNICSAKNKFLIVELCNDILVDTIVLANYEFFSSIFRRFRVSVSDRYPVKVEKWKDLGTYEARSTREVQAFLIENPLIWARYLRIEFLTHYGNEYYCPLSLLRVHGTTMMEEFRHQEEISRGDVSEDESVVEPEETAVLPVLQQPLISTDEAEKATVQAIVSVQTNDMSSAESSSTTGIASGNMQSIPTPDVGAWTTTATADVATSVPLGLETPTFSDLTCAPSVGSGEAQASPNLGNGTGVIPTHSTTTKAANATQIGQQPVSAPVMEPELSNTDSTPNTTSTSKHTQDATNSTHSLTVSHTTDAGSATNNASATGQPSSTVSSAPVPANSTRMVAASSTTAYQPQPSTQESFFKSIHKRLQQLESNSTLSLQYIEEQSRILREAFMKVEKRQINATTTFLTHLNGTVMAELHGFRQAYDQLWQSTVIELENQREQYQREMLALSTRLTLVADELVWQKRMGIMQSTLLLLCLGLVLFGRQGNGYLELPLTQHLMLKSQAALRSGWESEANSPSPSSRSPVSLFRRKVWRSNTEPAGNGSVTDATGTESRPGTRDGGPDVQFEPPTPSTHGAQSDADDSEEDQYEDVLTTQSGPATPNGSGAGLKRPPDLGARSSSPLRSEDSVRLA